MKPALIWTDIMLYRLTCSPRGDALSSYRILGHTTAFKKSSDLSKKIEKQKKTTAFKKKMCQISLF